MSEEGSRPKYYSSESLTRLGRMVGKKNSGSNRKSSLNRSKQSESLISEEDPDIEELDERISNLLLKTTEIADKLDHIKSVNKNSYEKKHSQNRNKEENTIIPKIEKEMVTQKDNTQIFQKKKYENQDEVNLSSIMQAIQSISKEVHEIKEEQAIMKRQINTILSILQISKD